MNLAGHDDPHDPRVVIAATHTGEVNRFVTLRRALEMRDRWALVAFIAGALAAGLPSYLLMR